MKYVIGIDFGTQSGRASVISAEDGHIAGTFSKSYPHGILTDTLPDGTTVLAPDSCYQVPSDYIDVLTVIVPEALRQSGIEKEQIVGMAMDCTSCTVIPLDYEWQPLCEHPGFEDHPNAYIKLWKHHAAQKQADDLNNKLTQYPNDFEHYYGKRISSEMMLPKAMEILAEDPEAYEAMGVFVELPDWLNYLLTDMQRASINTAGYKGMLYNGKSYPDEGFMKFINPALEHFCRDKQVHDICHTDKPFGRLNETWAQRLGLLPGTVVGCGVIDAHACSIGCGVTSPGKMMLALGTSSVQSVLSDHSFSGEGIVGAISGCTVPGYYAWETGLAAVGDQLAWFVEKVCGTDGADTGARLAALSAEAAALKPGECGLIALDWWNGNKTPYVQGLFSGALLGMRLNTTAADIFRALMESIAFGTRCITENYLRAGAEVRQIIACGGIAEKNEVLMQIIADVLGRDIHVSSSSETGTLGAAMIAAVAAGCYDDLEVCAEHMTHLREKVYHPDPAVKAAYDRLYKAYSDLSEYFGIQNSGFFEAIRF